MPKTNLTPAAFGLLARRVLTAAALPLLASASASAATYTWDPALNGVGSDGSGTWSELNANWATGSSDILWPVASVDIASFGAGGTPGPVTLSGGVSAAGLVFNSAYTISGSTISFSVASPTITTNANATILSALSGTNATLTKAGAAKLTINGPTAGLSTINVTAGTLSTAQGGSTSFGDSSTAIVVSSGASVQVASGAVAANPITFNGGSGAAAFIGGATLGGPISLFTGDTKINTSNAATISGAISGTGSLTLSGPNKLTLSGANTYSGGTNITDGILEVVSGGSLGTGAVSNATNLAFNTSTGTTLTVGNAISGGGSITKSGRGTAVLSGAVNSTGYTIISGGTLLVNGMKTGTTGASGSLLYVGGAGSVLGGTGTITGATAGAITVLAGGAIAPGLPGSIGTLSATSLSWTSDNVNTGMFFDLSSTDNTCDMLALTGAFSRAATTGSYIFDFGGTGAANTTYLLMTFASTSSISISNLQAIHLPGSTVARFDLTNNQLKVIVVVPEPSQVGFAFAAFAVLAIFLRRRRISPVALFKTIMKKQMVKNALQVALAFALVSLGVQTAGAKTVTIKLETATFDELQAAMNAGAITSVQMATLYLNRRAVYDQGGIKINSVVSINPTVLADAQAQDDLRANGTLLGPLQGLLFCTKDSYPTVGMVTSGGVKSWLSSVTGTFGTETGTVYGPVISPGDCFVVAKLKAAGAVQLGHGNMDTWATSASSTTSNAYGTTLNAYCLGSSSGSSGGPGALTGSNFANFAWGGETGGSIRNPSDRGGVTGFKVSVGTNSVNHIIPLASDRDVVGPMARYVKDEAYIMDASATVLDPDDLWYSINYVPGRGLSNGYATKLASASLAGKTIGVVGTYLGTGRPSPAPTPVQMSDSDIEKALGTGNGHGGILNFTTTTSSNTTGLTGTPPAIPQSDAPVLAAHNRLVTELQALGATVVTVFLPPNCDTAVTIPTKFTDNTSTPTATLAAPYSNQTLAYENAGFMNYFGQGIYTRLTQANAASSSLSTTVRNLAYNGTFSTFTDTTPVDITAHFRLKAIYNGIYEKFMDTAGPGGTPLDCLIWPVSYSKSRASNSVNGRDLVNNMGLPVCTVPIGVYPLLGGEPIDEAFLGRYRKEADVLAIAGAYQAGYNHRVPSPLSPPLDGETITYNDASTVLFAKRADKLAPIVSIKKKASVSGKSVLIAGIADDASGIGSLNVYVNGRKIPAKTGKKWTAKVSLADIKKWTKSKAKSIEVTVLAKDSVGNASATIQTVKI